MADKVSEEATLCCYSIRGYHIKLCYMECSYGKLKMVQCVSELDNTIVAVKKYWTTIEYLPKVNFTC